MNIDLEVDRVLELIAGVVGDQKCILFLGAGECTRRRLWGRRLSIRRA
jgi:hypothetical protein